MRPRGVSRAIVACCSVTAWLPGMPVAALPALPTAPPPRPAPRRAVVSLRVEAVLSRADLEGLADTGKIESPSAAPYRRGVYVDGPPRPAPPLRAVGSGPRGSPDGMGAMRRNGPSYWQSAVMPSLIGSRMGRRSPWRCRSESRSAGGPARAGGALGEARLVRVRPGRYPARVPADGRGGAVRSALPPLHIQLCAAAQVGWRRLASCPEPSPRTGLTAWRPSGSGPRRLSSLRPLPQSRALPDPPPS